MPKNKNKWTGPKIKELRVFIGCPQEDFKTLLNCSTRHYVSTLEKNGVKNGTARADILNTIETWKEYLKHFFSIEHKLKPLSYFSGLRDSEKRQGILVNKPTKR